MAENCVTITNLELVVDDKKPVYPSGFTYNPSAITWDEEIKTGRAEVDFSLTTPDEDIKEVIVFVVGGVSTRLDKNQNDFSGEIMLSGVVGEEISNSIYFEITDYATNIIKTDDYPETIEVVILDQKPPEGEFK